MDTPAPPTFPPCCTPDPVDAASRAYAAYNAGGDPLTAGLNYRGEPCPTWADLPENIREKWRAVWREARGIPEYRLPGNVLEPLGSPPAE